MLHNLRQYDVYNKGIDGIQIKTSGGGMITLISSILAMILFCNEVWIYSSTTVVNRMAVDMDPFKPMITIDLDMVVLHETCDNVYLDISDNRGSSSILLDSRISSKSDGHDGCHFRGQAVIQQDSGIISLKHSAGTDLYSMLDSLNFNSTHVIRHLNFGPFIPGMTVPLIDVHKVITDNVANYQYLIKLVPTKYIYLNQESVMTYQYSVTEHISQNQPAEGGVLSLIVPGVIFSFEFTPIKLEYVETKPTLLQFLTNTCAIIGGIFAVAGMIDRVVYKVSKVD